MKDNKIDPIQILKALEKRLRDEEPRPGITIAALDHAIDTLDKLRQQKGVACAECLRKADQITRLERLASNLRQHCYEYEENMKEICAHDKVYTKVLLTSYPPKLEWTCPKCGATGIDMIGSLDNCQEGVCPL